LVRLFPSSEVASEPLDELRGQRSTCRLRACGFDGVIREVRFDGGDAAIAADTGSDERVLFSVALQESRVYPLIG